MKLKWWFVTMAILGNEGGVNKKPHLFHGTVIIRLPVFILYLWWSFYMLGQSLNELWRDELMKP